jgi:tRNA (mo5U34)-methyltransferase
MEAPIPRQVRNLAGRFRSASGRIRRAFAARTRPARRVDVEIAGAKEEYQALWREFEKNAPAAGCDDPHRFYWYHTIDLGDGLVTPGDYDYRSSLPRFGFPDDMSGLEVLDVGSATGFFAFEFERRGAQVTSLELPSIADWDMLPSEGPQVLDEMIQGYRAESMEDLHRMHLDGPFEFCRRRLGSRIVRRHATVYDVTADLFDGNGFDLVYVGDVLPHMFSPLKALGALARVCRRTLVIAQDLSELGGPHPLMQYVGGDSRANGGQTWWLPNFAAMQTMLRRVGFRTVSQVGFHEGVLRRVWAPYRRAIIHASKS